MRTLLKSYEKRCVKKSRSGFARGCPCLPVATIGEWTVAGRGKGRDCPAPDCCSSCDGPAPARNAMTCLATRSASASCLSPGRLIPPCRQGDSSREIRGAVAAALRCSREKLLCVLADALRDGLTAPAEGMCSFLDSLKFFSGSFRAMSQV